MVVSDASRVPCLDDRPRVTSYTRPQIRALLRHTTNQEINTDPTSLCNNSRSIDCAPLHLPFGIHDDPCIVLEIEEHPIPPPPRFTLTADHSGHNYLCPTDQLIRDRGEGPGLTFLSEFGFAFLDGRHDHITGCCCGKSIETSSETDDGDDVEVWSGNSGESGTSGVVRSRRRKTIRYHCLSR